MTDGARSKAEAIQRLARSPCGAHNHHAGHEEPYEVKDAQR